MAVAHGGELRGALIGCGFFGRIHMEAWRRMPDVAIVAACDAEPVRAQEVSARAYTDAATMLASEELDFVDIATRPDTHLELVRLAVNQGIPVICQKPLAESLEQAREMAELVRTCGARVMVHENWRWQPWYREVKRRITAGEIGTPLAYQFRMRQRDGLGEQPYPNQPYFREMARLLVYETLIHLIDTARFLFGEIEAVTAHLRRYNPRIAGEDRALLLLEHTQGVADGVIDGHRWANPIPPGPAMGDAVFEGESGTLTVLASGAVYRDGDLVTVHDTATGYKGDSVRATQRHFADCLRSGAAFETGVIDYWNSFATAEAAYRSAAEARRVLVEEL